MSGMSESLQVSSTSQNKYRKFSKKKLGDTMTSPKEIYCRLSPLQPLAAAYPPPFPESTKLSRAIHIPILTCSRDLELVLDSHHILNPYVSVLPDFQPALASLFDAIRSAAGRRVDELRHHEPATVIRPSILPNPYSPTSTTPKNAWLHRGQHCRRHSLRPHSLCLDNRRRMLLPQSPPPHL
jgi:hypothetical protein